MFIEHLSESAASTQLLEDCWPSSLPAAQQPAPADVALRWFRSLIERDPVHQSLPAAERETLCSSALEIERRVPMLTGNGSALPTPHRLYLALEIAKVLFARSRSTLNVLQSIVVYSDGGQLLRGKPEAGFALVRGRNQIVRRLDVIDAFWRATEKLRVRATHRRRTGKQRITDEKFDEVRRQLRSWKGMLQAGHRVDGQQLAEFAEKLQTEIRPLLRDLGRSLATRLDVPDASLLPSFDAASSLITENAGLIAAARDVVERPNQASIHLSWVAQIATTHTPNHNLIVHELAHVLDFEYGGIDGVASPHAKSEGTAADLGDRWAAAYDEAVEQPPAFLAPYGLVDRGEFFAVCSEHYFSAATSLAPLAPELFDLLKRTYGYVPHDRVPASTFSIFKTLFLSKLRTSF